MEQDLDKALRGTDAVILAVRHQSYLHLDPDQVVETCGGPVAIIDCFGILDDAKIKRYFELGCEVKGLGRGHVKRIKDQGGSTQHALPVLAAYMGHRKYHYTHAYLKVSDAKHVAGLIAFSKSRMDQL